MSRTASQENVFYAVADPTRRRILDLLSEGERSVNELVEQFSVSQPAVSQHLRVLREVDLVHSRKRGRQRLYRLDGTAIRAVFDWAKHYEEFWNERLLRLGEVLDKLPDDDDETNG